MEWWQISLLTIYILGLVTFFIVFVTEKNTNVIEGTVWAFLWPFIMIWAFGLIMYMYFKN